jgi:hypothetical protein
MMIRGKNLKAAVQDMAEGFIIVNPILLKSLDAETIKELNHNLALGQAEIRREKFPHKDIQGIRQRNMRLQRLHQASIVLRNFAKQRKVPL